MLDTSFGIITLIVVCALFLVLGVAYSWKRRGQSVEDYTVSRNHAPVNVGIAAPTSSLTSGHWTPASASSTTLPWPTIKSF